jgi:prevent-host-death family protein
MLRTAQKNRAAAYPELLDAAEQGHSTIITRHGRPVPVFVPITAYGAEIEVGIGELDAGQGEPLDIEEVIAQARNEHGAG